VGEPEDLLGCSRTVFGAKIMCGLIFLINPPSCKKTGDFFLPGHNHDSIVGTVKRFFATILLGQDNRGFLYEKHCDISYFFTVYS
jgi:hypothetical protein